MTQPDQFDTQAEELLPTLDIVFDGPPSHESGRFVEVEVNGRSINAGTWLERDDGLWTLRITPNPTVAAALRAQNEKFGQQMNDVVRRMSDDIKELDKEISDLRAHLERVEIHHGKTETPTRGKKDGSLEDQVEYWRTRYFVSSKLANGWEETCDDLRAEIERLKRLNDEQRMSDAAFYSKKWQEEVSALKAQLADAKQEAEDNYTQGQKRGMVKTLDLFLNYKVATKHVGVIADACAAIRAEIEKSFKPAPSTE